MTIVKIGAIDYEVKEIEYLRDGDEKLDGHVKHHLCEIHIEADQSALAKRQVLWHEILHVILIQAGYQKHSDGAIDSLAFGIMALLRNNPWLGDNEEGS